MRTSELLVAVVLVVSGSANAQQKRTMTFEDFAAVRAVSDPQPSPDGKLVLFSLRTTDVVANKRTSQTFVVATSGGTPKPFPGKEISGVDAFVIEARWSPEGKQ